MDWVNRILGVNRIQKSCIVLVDYGGDNALPILWEALPSVAIVGGQSSGKSSVLESIVGRDFYFEDLIHKIDDGTEYAEFFHIPKKRFTDFGSFRVENDYTRCNQNRTLSLVFKLEQR